MARATDCGPTHNRKQALASEDDGIGNRDVVGVRSVQTALDAETREDRPDY
jgi:hypothetical protein